MRPLPIALLLALATASGAAIAAVRPPHVAAQSFDALPRPLPLPYDAAANAGSVVAKARAGAKATHKLLLIDLGGNWCPDCRILAGTMELPGLRAFIARHYELVTVDVGRFDRNLDIPAHYGITKRLEGVPSLLVVDPVKDRLLNDGHVAALADARHMSPQGIADYLAQWIR